ncbi:hypothetical protein EST92_01285 [Streptomyces sp. TM32]|nr:hypothetical protein EST92_01285 [Streptomyces sp. TM32]
MAVRHGAAALGGATLVPSTLSLIRNMFSDDGQRRTVIAVWTGGFAGGAVLGPLLAGHGLLAGAVRQQTEEHADRLAPEGTRESGQASGSGVATEPAESVSRAGNEYAIQPLRAASSSESTRSDPVSFASQRVRVSRASR